MPHVHGVAEDDEPGHGLLGRREPAVGHALGDPGVAVEGRFERGPDRGGQGGQDDVGHVAADAAAGGRGLGQALGHVDEDAGLARADLVQENGAGGADDDVAVPGARQVAVEELERVELAADDGRLGDVLLAEARGVAVGHDGQLPEEAVGLLLAARGAGLRRARLDAQDLGVVVALDGADGLGLEHADVGVLEARPPQLRDEAAVVEASPLRPGRFFSSRLAIAHLLARGPQEPLYSRVRHADVLAVVEHVEPMTRHGVDVFDAVPQTQFRQGVNAAGLHQLADDSVRFLHPSLEEDDAPALVG